MHIITPRFCINISSTGGVIVQSFEKLISFVNGVVWGPAMLGLLIGAGLYLTVRTGFLQFKRFGFMLKNTVFELFDRRKSVKIKGEITPFQAVATAMAGTIGTGSIAGLATAICSGGPGAIFWMWISAIIGMVTKYSEIVLSLKYREKNKKGEWVGGPMYYIKNGLQCKWLAAVFALFGTVACLGTGNAAQSNSISSAIKSTLGTQTFVTGAVITVICAFVIIGGMKRIAVVNERLVPFMAVFYVVCCAAVLVIRANEMPKAFMLIFKEAFNIKSVTGGAYGYGIMLAVRYGFSRGVFSNEAGLGSAPIAHASSNSKSPVKQGLWGMFEVSFTTLVICTLSGLVVLTGDLWQGGLYKGAALSIASFDSAIPFFGGFCVSLSTVLFAFSSILGWAYYGEVCVGYLFKKSDKAVLIYRIIYVVIIYVGSVSSLEAVWGVSEIMNGLMAIPNLAGVIGLSGVVASVTKEHFKNVESEKR